ncbi:MAG: CHAT domain-containing protein [Cyanobacteria bacterium J06636_16]
MGLIKVLILTANPKISDSNSLRLDAEVRQIKEAIRRSQYRERYELETELATRTKDLRRTLLDYRPKIAHFSGHGSGEKGLVLENDAGEPQFLSTEALVQLFQVSEFCDIECVLLNACYSEVQAIAIHQVVDCVIGMNQPISDKAALLFSEGFYDALGAGLSYEEAYKAGCAAISMEGNSDYEVPALKIRKRRDRLSVAPVSSVQPTASQPVSPLSAQHQPSQSQSFGNVSISGSNSLFNPIQSGGDVKFSQNLSQSRGENKELQAALDALAQLRQTIQVSKELSRLEKRETDARIEMLEEELQKPQPDKSFIDEIVDALEKGLSGVMKLTSPITQVASLIAKAYSGLA